MNRRNLLINKGLFINYPKTCIFLIEEIFNDIEGSDFWFDLIYNKNDITDDPDELNIYFKDNNGDDTLNWCPVEEFNSYIINNTEVFNIFDSEKYLEQYYNENK